MDTLNTAAIGLAVKLARDRLQITANDLAKQTGINPSSLSRTEKGLRMLDLDEATRIARVLGMGIEELVNMAIQLERSGAVQQQKEAREDFARAIKNAKAALGQALESVRETEN